MTKARRRGPVLQIVEWRNGGVPARVRFMHGLDELPDLFFSPAVFYVSDYMIDQGYIELRPWTVTGLLRGLVVNAASLTWYRLTWALFRVGFLDPRPGEYVQFRRDWRWRFWRTQRLRRAR